MRTPLPLVAPLIFLLASPAVSRAQPAPTLGTVPTDSFGFLTVNVGKLWENPGFKPLRAWFEAQKSGPTDELFGLPVGDIERITLFLPTADRRPLAGALITTKQPLNEAKVIKSLGSDGGPPRRSGNAVRFQSGRFDTLIFGDERTLLFLKTDGELGVAGLLGQVLAKRTDGPLADALAGAAKHDFAFALDGRPLATLLQADREPELAPYLALFSARTITFAADFDKTARGTFKMTFADEAGAKRAAPVLKEGIADIIGVFEKGILGKGQLEPAERAYFENVVAVLKAAKVESSGSSVVATADLPHLDAVAKLAAVLPKSYAGAVDSRRGQNNLKQLALAFHNFESAYGVFPSDVTPAGGPKPIPMSWRVQVLPYIEQGNLLKQLDWTKAWDDPVNLKKLESMEMPKVFEIPGRPAPKGHTYFRVFSLPKSGKEADRPFFAEGQKGPTITSITDGVSNTLMIVEAGEAVPWYKPDLLAYDAKAPLPQLGDKAADRFIAAMADGSVRVLRPSKVGENALRAIITAQGGEVISIP
ncbi:hypothetical protein GobsT_42420 [Gemmata obscuriglobus]|uniref:DUF1559 domain-containing protein n=1 Tax=Gemmata obscuriglobus TaxID=114 RepID=A0A2Z3GVJ7_9BACT|nr:DUF1559 domain-containing protein [Gemmata obscuriglobus]AWM37743.1 DUF1559 domain-containing protein [Gemmata obscuriglobus]QEG29446.1 hypothetical protein GobsT_42420 [Gemmata obscuriglobus]VTS08566.1 Antirepressor regulating drug resistance protein OS=Singulisphaera acidiphila (strain ATCC BAA-1392 / DSM 18658 / VKM B-2454 / MOB10) GN=Sinac_6540 PE=4 SV=1: SBP_bac_10 [Gemmata obscuriglobus UQM 2246]